ncbi:MAG: type I restriction endonuclease subunit R, partial [Victivallales bacterium]|nr:type I restriction endonuclease subunit R [Victivallales bacterium]
KASQYIASSGADLVRKLNGNPSFIFTLIQKFNNPDPKPIRPDHDIILMSDEAHRTQNGIFADNMMKMLPTASRIGFTGTPLLSNDNITARTFGGYVSIYDFKRAVEDGATVPLYYENRGEKILDLRNPEINDRILDAIEAADLDVDKMEKLEAEFAKEIHLLTAEPRLRSIARDFAKHYSDLWTSGKAMFVCLNKVTCVRMYDYVQEYWQAEIKELEGQKKHATQQEAQEIDRKLKWLQETEMAVVISQDQNEIQTFKKWGLDILSHRKKMEKRELDKEFKDAANPLRVVFVCAMWLTGFDVKCLSCLYLDKPLKAHTLMQTIARANRVAEGKSNGLIIDYIGIVKALRKALADYTMNSDGQGGNDPTIDKEKLLEKILDTIAKAKLFLHERGFELQELIDAANFMKVEVLQDAADAVCGSLEDKKTFSMVASELIRLMKYANKENITDAARKEFEAIRAIYGVLQKKRKHVDTIDLMVQINAIIGQYVKMDDKSFEVKESRRFDISKIDFDLLRREFARARRKNLMLKDLQEVIQAQLDRMLFNNPDRINFYERYQQIIADYNGEQDHATIEKTFMELMALANSLEQEEQRYIREGFESDEELSLYDLLFKNDLSKSDIKKIKEVATTLLQRIKTKIAELDHWTDKQETKAEVDNLIRDTLWSELPESYDEISISEYRQRIYEYVYARYKDVS